MKLTPEMEVALHLGATVNPTPAPAWRRPKLPAKPRCGSCGLDLWPKDVEKGATMCRHCKREMVEREAEAVRESLPDRVTELETQLAAVLERLASLENRQ